jgi:hypothetical protein
MSHHPSSPIHCTCGRMTYRLAGGVIICVSCDGVYRWPRFADKITPWEEDWA